MVVVIVVVFVEFFEVWIFEERESVEMIVDVFFICLLNLIIISEGG